MLHRLRDKWLLLAVTTGVIVLYVHRKSTDADKRLIRANLRHSRQTERLARENHYRLTKEARDVEEE